MLYSLLLKYECYTQTEVEANSFDEAVQKVLNDTQYNEPEVNDGIVSIFDTNDDNAWME